MTALEAPNGAGCSLSLSLVIPAYNEEARLPAGMARLQRAVDVGSIDPLRTQFVVVDDGSSDATSERARALLSRYPHVQSVRFDRNRGKGAAVRAGVAAANAPVIAFADADMAIDPAQTPQFVAALDRADLAIGSRAASGASVDRPSISRSIMNRAFNRFVNVLTRVSLDDTQCGFKAFRAPGAKLLFHCSVTERMAFDVEILSLARRLGLSIEQVPVQWLRVRGSRVRSWSDSHSMVRDVLRAHRRVLGTAPSVEGFPRRLRSHRPRQRWGTWPGTSPYSTSPTDEPWSSARSRTRQESNHCFSRPGAPASIPSAPQSGFSGSRNSGRSC